MTTDKSLLGHQSPWCQMKGLDKLISRVSYGLWFMITVQGSICGKWVAVTLSGGNFTQENRLGRALKCIQHLGIFSHELSVLKGFKGNPAWPLGMLGTYLYESISGDPTKYLSSQTEPSMVVKGMNCRMTVWVQIADASLTSFVNLGKLPNFSTS